MKKKFDQIQQNCKPICRWDTYGRVNTNVSGVYTLEETFVRSNIDLMNIDQILNLIQNQQLTLIFFKSTIEIEGNDQVQEYIVGILLDANLNIMNEINIGNFKISFYGDIKNEKNHLIRKGIFHLYNQPFYGRVLLSSKRIYCPSESAYLEHYKYLVAQTKDLKSEV